MILTILLSLHVKILGLQNQRKIGMTFHQSSEKIIILEAKLKSSNKNIFIFKVQKHVLYVQSHMYEMQATPTSALI